MSLRRNSRAARARRTKSSPLARHRRRTLALEPLEDRRMLATFAPSGTTLDLTLDQVNENVAVVSNGANYSLSLTGGTWSGTDGANVTGNGTATLTVTPAGLAAFDTVNITDAAVAGTSVTFNDSGVQSYSDDFEVTLDHASPGLIVFNGATTFSGSDLGIDTNGAVNVNGNLDGGGALTIESQGISLAGTVAADNSILLDAGAGEIVDASANTASKISTVNATLIAGAGIGASDAIETNITKLTLTNGTGATRLVNDGDITLASITTGGTLDFTAGSALAISGAVNLGGDATFTATDEGGAGDDVSVLSTAAITANGHNVTFNAGDNFLLEAGATITGAANVIVNADDPAAAIDVSSGSTVSFLGTITATQLMLNGGDDNDTFNVTPSADTPIAVFGDDPTVAPGDQLFVPLGGIADAVVVPGSPSTNGTIVFTGGSHGNISYNSIETLLAAGSLVVDTEIDETANNGFVSLREAIAFANTNPGADTITFAPALTAGGPATILLELGELQINGPLTINGTGARLLTIDASGNDSDPGLDNGGGSRIFTIDDGNAGVDSPVTIRGLTLKGGDVTGAGGAILSAESLSVFNTTITDNAATTDGGGISTSASLRLVSSTASGNSAGGNGGGIFSDISSAGVTTRITNSTISGNQAAQGGGVFNNNGVTIIEFSTVTNNSVPVGNNGGGVFSNNAANTNTQVRSSIIAGNTNSDVSIPANPTSFESLGYNLIGFGNAQNDAGEFAATGDTKGVANPQLAPLAWNGGPTQTHMPLPGSPAIDKGNPADAAGVAGVPTFDQRGMSRVRDNNAEPGTAIDIGAVETENFNNGPQVTDVFITGNENYGLFGNKPTAVPTPLAHSITIKFRDLPPRTPPIFGDYNDNGVVDAADFVVWQANEGLLVTLPNDATPGEIVGQSDFDVWASNFGNVDLGGDQSFVFDEFLAANPGYFLVVGDYNGIIPIASIIVTNDPITVVGQPATASIELIFAKPLPDDRYTLIISDSLTDLSGDHLDGESNAVQPLFPTFPSGDGVEGGDFSARFTIDSRPELGVAGAGQVILDTNGNFHFDPTNLDFTNRDLAFAPGFFSTDVVFAGKFVRPDGTLDGFDHLAAYGRVGNRWRFLIDVDGNTVFEEVITPTAAINGVPVAGNFDGDATNGDEVGLFDGTKWYFDLDRDFAITGSEATGQSAAYRGFPVVGDFDGDGRDDVGTYDSSPGNNRFSIDLNSAAAGSISIDGTADKTFTVGPLSGGPYGFAGVMERPVAADMNADGAEDLGLWVPQGAGVFSGPPGEWYFLLTSFDAATATGDIIDRVAAVEALLPAGTEPFIPFTTVPFGDDQFAQFGNQYMSPVVGNFDPPVASGTAARAASATTATSATSAKIAASIKSSTPTPVSNTKLQPVVAAAISKAAVTTALVTTTTIKSSATATLPIVQAAAAKSAAAKTSPAIVVKAAVIVPQAATVSVKPAGPTVAATAANVATKKAVPTIKASIPVVSAAVVAAKTAAVSVKPAIVVSAVAVTPPAIQQPEKQIAKVVAAAKSATTVPIAVTSKLVVSPVLAGAVKSATVKPGSISAPLKPAAVSIKPAAVDAAIAAIYRKTGIPVAKFVK